MKCIDNVSIAQSFCESACPLVGGGNALCVFRYQEFVAPM
jgi:hypothetical protein